MDAGEGILPVGEVPHCWLFPRAAAVVHHGGAGTTGAVFRAGVPAVVTPIYADQPLWGARVDALGVGPAPIPFTRLTADPLAGALRAACGNRTYRANARRLSRLIAAETGTAPVVEAVNRLQAG